MDTYFDPTPGLATVSLSQFIGWVFPAFGFLIIAVVIRVGNFGRFTSLLGFLTVILTIIGGTAFLHPVTSLQKFQLPGLAMLGRARSVSLWESCC